MNEPAFLSLLGIEFRRIRRQLLGITGLYAVIAAIIAALGHGTPNKIAALLSMWGFSVFLFVPTGVLKDRLDGSMEFLTTLPVKASTLVGARFAASILLAGLGSVAVAIASGLALPPFLGSVGTGRVIAVAMLLGWVVLSAISCAGTALLSRFKLRVLQTYVPITLFGVGFAFIYSYEPLFGNPLDTLRAVMADDRAPYIVAAAIVLGAAAVLAVSFLLARRAMEEYRPQHDSIDW